MQQSVQGQLTTMQAEIKKLQETTSFLVASLSDCATKEDVKETERRAAIHASKVLFVNSCLFICLFVYLAVQEAASVGRNAHRNFNLIAKAIN